MRFLLLNLNTYLAVIELKILQFPAAKTRDHPTAIDNDNNCNCNIATATATEKFPQAFCQAI